jgi:hypothetical protein
MDIQKIKNQFVTMYEILDRNDLVPDGVKETYCTLQAAALQQEVSTPEVEAQSSPTHKYQTGKVWAISESTPEGLSIEGNHNWKEGQLLSEGEDFYKAENYFTKKGHPTSFNSDHHEYSEEVAIPLLQPSPTVQEPSTEHKKEGGGQ